MPINFPNSPTNGQVYTVGSRSWVWNSANSTWDSTTVALQGIQGIQGLQGIQGIQGIQGASGALGSSNPLALGAATPGTATVVSREDHVHPTTGLALLGTDNTFTASNTLRAGTATAGTAPLYFQSGTVLGTAVAGAMEFDGTRLYFSPSTTRQAVALTSADGTTLLSSITASSLTSLGTLTGLTVTGTGTNAVSITTGTTGILTLNSGSTGAINIGYDNTYGKTISIGNTNTGTAITLSAGATYYSISGTSSQADIVAATVNLGTTNTTTAINVGTSASAKTLTFGNATGASGIVLDSGTNGVKVNVAASGAGFFRVDATGIPTTDMVTISNSGVGLGVTTATVSALQISYQGGTGAIESSAQRIDLTPGATSGATWNGLRIVPSSGAASGVTMNGIKFNNITGSTGTDNVFYVGTGYDNILNYNGTTVINGTGQLALGQVTGTLGLTNGGTNANITAAAGAVVYSTASALAVSAVGTSGQVLISGASGAPTWTSNPTALTGITVTGTGTNVVSLTTGTTGALTLDTGSTGAINIGTNANAKAITLGNSTAGTTFTLNSGVSGITFNAGSVNLFAGTGGSTVQIATDATSTGNNKTVWIGLNGAAGSTTNITLGTASAATAITTVTYNGKLVRSTAAQTVTAWTTSGQALAIDGATFTDSSTAAAGTVTTRAVSSFGQPTLGSTNSITVTDASTVYIANAPTAALNTTITNAHALHIAAGTVKIGAFSTAGIVTNTAAGVLQSTASLSLALGGTNANITAAAGAVVYSTASALAVSAAAAGAGYVLVSGTSGTGAPTWTNNPTTLTGLTITGTGTNVISLTTGTSGALTLDTGTTGAINIGTNANAKTITIGNNQTGTAVDIISGSTGGISLESNNGNVDISPASTGSHTISIGGGAVTNGFTKQISIGAAGAAGSTTQITLGSSATTTSLTTITYNGRLQRNTAFVNLASWTTVGSAFDIPATTYTNTTAGNVTTQVMASLSTPTFASSSALTVTNAATLYIANAPTAGTNTTITNSYAIFAAAGKIRFGALASAGFVKSDSNGELSVDTSTYITSSVTTLGSLTSASSLATVGTVTAGEWKSTVTLPTATNTASGGLYYDATYNNLRAGDGSVGQLVPQFEINTTAKSGAYTLTAGDSNTVVQVSAAVTISIPANATDSGFVAYPVGTQIHILQTTTNQVTIAALAGANAATVNSVGATSSSPKLRAQWSMATCIKTATNTWVVVGDIV